MLVSRGAYIRGGLYSGGLYSGFYDIIRTMKIVHILSTGKLIGVLLFQLFRNNRVQKKIGRNR